MARQLRLVLVTPETTLLDEPVAALQFPLYDGQIGILPGRTPLVGRLGYGELRIRGGADEQRYFIDGGFVQIKGEIVTLLTNRALPAAQVSLEAAQEQLAQAQARVARAETEHAAKSRALQRARQMLAVARHRA